MTIEKMLDIINVKISGLNTLDFEQDSKRVFGRWFHTIALYKTDFPEGVRSLINSFHQEKYEDVESDVIEYLFDIIITEEYKKWKNYGLVNNMD